MHAMVYQKLLSILDSGEKAVTVTLIGENPDQPERCVLSESDLKGVLPGCSLSEHWFNAAKTALVTGELYYENKDGTIGLVEPSFPEPRLIVLGGGHIAKPLVEFGAKLGFLVTVADDRPSFANTARFPDAEHVICESFERVFDKISINSSSYVVIVTRGHRHDMDCYRKIAHLNMAYVGMIGSKRRIKGLKEQLEAEGFLKEHMEKLNAPIGLDIGAITPEEIALSILAQVVSFRRKSVAGDIKVNSPELDRTVLEEISQSKNDPKAIVTVIGTKGSVPRKEGAKMLVWPYGKTLGSIGGGCSESEVITVARDIIREGGCRTMKVDMTGNVAEDEGMVCGGIMEVLIEAYLP